MTRPSSSPDPLAGLVLEGRYRLEEQIGSGGMCVVYRGFDQRLERLVAVKIAHEHLLGNAGPLGDQKIEERFKREALAMARLSDPGLVGVYDHGSAGGRPYVVLEYVAGGTVRELLAERGAMPPYAAAALLEPVLRALGTAHSFGFVHGDVKPENILISTANEVKIADFGSVVPHTPAVGTGWSQHVGDQPDRSDVFGTAAYLAPEQVETALWAFVSPQVDVYAAGVMLYELLTGVLPFAGESPAEIANARLVHDVPPPSRAVDGVPMQFDHLVLRATERDLRARYPDARSMAAELERVRTELGLPPYTVPVPEARAASPQAAVHLTTPAASRSPAPSAAQHTTISLAPIADRTQNPEPASASAAAKAVGDPTPPSINVRQVSIWFVVVLLLGVAAVVAGYGLAAVLEHQLS